MKAENLTLEDARQIATLKHETATVFMRQVQKLHQQVYAYRNKLTQMAKSLESWQDGDEVMDIIKADVGEMLRIPTEFTVSGFPADQPPEPKPGWDHSELVLVYYPEGEVRQAAWGIAYYHYKPPFKSAPEWVDFRHGTSSRPIMWWPMPPVPNVNGIEDVVLTVDEAKEWFLEHAEGTVTCQRMTGSSMIQRSVSSYPDAVRFYKEDEL